MSACRIRLKQRGVEQDRRHGALQARAEKMESEIFLRAQELRESNRQLRETNDQLARRNAERTELYDRLHRIDQLKTRTGFQCLKV